MLKKKNEWKGLSSITKAGRKFPHEIFGKIRASAAVQQVEYIHKTWLKDECFYYYKFFPFESVSYSSKSITRHSHERQNNLVCIRTKSRYWMIVYKREEIQCGSGQWRPNIYRLLVKFLAYHTMNTFHDHN